MSEFRKLKSLKFLYEVNSEGIVRNVKSKKVVKGYKEKNGYIRVKFENKCLGGVVRTTVHRLVAEAFIPNPLGLEEVNHIDSVRDNNNVNNLEWVSHSSNMKHACEVGKHANEIRQNLRNCREKNKRKVSCGDMTFESISDAGRWLQENGLCKSKESGTSGVYAVCNKKRPSFGKRNWFYV